MLMTTAMCHSKDVRLKQGHGFCSGVVCSFVCSFVRLFVCSFGSFVCLFFLFVRFVCLFACQLCQRPVAIGEKNHRFECLSLQKDQWSFSGSFI